MSKVSTTSKLWEFFKGRKKWWLTPILVLIILLAVFLIINQGPELSPFIYTFF